MPCYARPEDAASALTTTVSTLEDLERWDWILIVDEDGRRYVPRHYKSLAQFVLNLRWQLQMEPGQVTALLPPEKLSYFYTKIDDIVASLRSRKPEIWENLG